MSRSRKKTPSAHIVKKQGWMKAKLSRRVRKFGKASDITDGNACRKLNDSYDIADWHDTWTSFEDFKRQQKNWGRYVDEEQCRNDYERWYKRK